MATQPPVSPDIIEPQSPSEVPPGPVPIEEPVPQEPDATPPDSLPGGGDIDEPGRGPDEVPPRIGEPDGDHPDSAPQHGEKMGFDVQQRPRDG